MTEIEEFRQIFARNLKQLLNLRDKTQVDLTNYMGVSSSTVSDWCNGKKMPRMDKIQRICDWLHVSRTDLLENKEPIDRKKLRLFETQKRSIPFLGDIACGEPIIATTIDYFVIEGEEINADFALRAKGDSMINARIMDGDLVFIKSQPSVNNGEIAAVIIDDEATLKRVYFDEATQTMTLCAENSAYAPMVFSGEILSRVRVLGKAVAFQSVKVQ